MSAEAPSTARGEEPAKVGFDVAAWGLVLYAGARAIQLLLDAHSLAASVGQAVLAEWGASRLGVVWTDPKADASTGAVARRLLAGAGLGLGLAALAAALPLVTRSVLIERAASLEWSVLLIGLVGAAVQAWRDELLLHGVVLQALPERVVSPVGRVLACALTSAGAALGRSDATARTVFVAALLGAVFGALWVQDRGALRPWAAHTALRWTTGTLLAGGLVQLRLSDDLWSGGSAGLLAGTAAAVALAPAGVLAVVWAALRRSSPGPARVG